MKQKQADCVEVAATKKSFWPSPDVEFSAASVSGRDGAALTGFCGSSCCAFW
jgi:hypothetical protein